MRALIQRVSRAEVRIESGQTHSIGPGLLVFLGVKESDDITLCGRLAEKCAGLRIFTDNEGKMNRSAIELGFEALIISNFTLFADTKKGKRPSFSAASRPELGEDCYDEFVSLMREQGLKDVKTGEFGATMDVELVNDGPVTIMMDTEEWQKT